MSDRKWNPDELEKQKTEFDGTVIKAEWIQGKAFRAGQEPSDQLHLVITPTSYSSDKNREAWVNYSEFGELRGGRMSKWSRFLTACKKVGVDLTKDPHEQLLVGKNFHFLEESEDVEISEADGTVSKKQSRLLLPTKLVGTGTLPEATGSTGAGAAADIDEWIKATAKDGISIDDLYTKGAEKGFKQPQIMARVKNLQKSGVVSYEDRAVATL